MVPPTMVAEKRDMEEKAGGSKRARTGEPDWVLEAVLDSKVREAVPLVLALAVEVVDRRQTSALVKTLADLAPLGSLQHLKRVRSSKDAVTGAASVQLLLWAAGEGREGGGQGGGGPGQHRELVEAILSFMEPTGSF